MLEVLLHVSTVFTDTASLPSQHALDPTFPMLELQAGHLAQLQAAGDSNSGPNAFPAGVLSTESSSPHSEWILMRRTGVLTDG